VVLEGLHDDEEQQSGCNERDRDRLAQADHRAGDDESDRRDA
jgi:hypothetical protein